MKRSEKQAFVEEFRERVQGSPVFYLTDFTGLDVKEMTELRQKLKEQGADYLVVKNRLALRALGDLEVPDVSGFLAGPTGVVLGADGPVAPAKALREFAKDHGDRPAFKVGVIENRIVDIEQFKRLAALPTRDELLAELAGAMEAPLAAFAGAMEAKLQETAGLLEALRQERETSE